MIPFELVVCSLAQAQTALEQGWQGRAVLIGPIPDSALNPQHLHLSIDNVTAPLSGSVVPNQRHVQTVLDYTAQLEPGDALMLACHSGQGISPSLALGVLCQQRMDPVEAIECMEALCPFMNPNELIIHLLDSILGQRLALVDAYQAWADRNPDQATNRMSRMYRRELDDNARELYRMWDQFGGSTSTTWRP